MTKALYIGQYIYSALVNNGITAKIYRIIADSNAKYPFIIYRRIYDADLRARLADKYTTVTKHDCDLANEWWDKFTAWSPEQLRGKIDSPRRSRCCPR